MSSTTERKNKEFRGIPLQLEITSNVDLSTYESSPIPLRNADLNSYNLNSPLRTNEEPLVSPGKVFFEKNPLSSLPDVSFKKSPNANKVRFDEESLLSIEGFKEARSFGLENIIAELSDPEFEREMEEYNEIDNTFLDRGTLKSDVVLHQLREATEAIRLRDQMIEQLVKDKDEYKIEVKKYEVQIEKLEETIDKLQENFEKSYGPNGSAFEMSSYINPPKANSTLISEIPYMLNETTIETHERTCQTEELTYVNNGTQIGKLLETVDQTTQANEEISRENQNIQVELRAQSKEEHSQTKWAKKDSSISTDETLTEAKSCQTPIQELDPSVLKEIEVRILKEFSKKALPEFLSLNPMREFTVQNLAEFLCAVQEKQIQTIENVKMEHSVDLDKLNEDRINLSNEIEYLKETNCNQFEEIRSLKTKIAQLEDSKISYERKLTSLSARLTPEGSELDVQSVSLAAEEMISDAQLNETPLRDDCLGEAPSVNWIGDGEVLERSGGGSVEPPITASSSVIDDLKLQLIDLEKKYESNKKYLEEQTTEREVERDEFHKELESLQFRINSERKEKEKLEDLLLQQKSDFEDNENRLKEAYNYEQELIANSEKLEDELRSAVEKIEELRDIIKEHEVQIDSAAEDVKILQEQNVYFRKELEKKAELLKEKEDLMNQTQDTIQTVTSDLTEELYAQIEDLSKKFEKKLVEMDNFQWTNRPDSGCSGGISNSTEDVSVRELTIINRERKEWSPVEASSIISKGLQNLDSHFDSLVRFEEVIIKKLKDTEMRFTVASKKLKELESQRQVYQQKCQEQIAVISDLEGRLDQFRFEPSPNAVTLRGLKARVVALNQELEEYKGKLELKEIEMQDLSNKNAANQALLLNTKNRETPTTVGKSTAGVQTERNEQKTNSTQTRMNLKAATRESGMQTVNNLHSSPHFDTLDLSTIQGGPPPKHSTPNDYDAPKGKVRSKKLESRTLISTLTLEENPKSPEILRTEITRNASIQSEQKSNKFKTVSFEDPQESIKGFADNSEIEDAMGDPDETLNYASLRFHPLEGKDLAPAKSLMSNKTLASMGHIPKEMSSAVTSQPRSGQLPSSYPLARKSSSRHAQTPPIAVEGLVASLSDEERKTLLMNLKGSLPAECTDVEREKNVEIVKLRERIEELETLLTREKGEIEKASCDPEPSVVLQGLGAQELSFNLSDNSQYQRVKSKPEIPMGSQRKLEGSKQIRPDTSKFGTGEVGGKSFTPEDWNRLEKEQSERVAATDNIVEAEALRTQISQITSEISKYQFLHEDQIKKLHLDKDKCIEMVKKTQRSSEARKANKTIEDLEQALDLEIQFGQNLRIEMCEQLRLINSQKLQLDMLMEEKKSLMEKLQRCESINQEYSQLPSGSRKTDRRFLELYLRTKSYRKALGWQKRYLSVVVLGYKDLLSATGVTYDHPEILQREIPLSPGAVGICDLKKPKTRFKIAVCAIMAVFRMKYMVRRWAVRTKGPLIISNVQTALTYKAPLIESESSSDSNTNPVIFSPPTREAKNQFRPTRFRKSENSSKYPNSHESEKREEEQLKEVFPNKDEEQNLLEYLERFNRLEKEIGQTIRLNRNTLTQKPNNR